MMEWPRWTMKSHPKRRSEWNDWVFGLSMLCRLGGVEGSWRNEWECICLGMTAQGSNGRSRSIICGIPWMAWGEFMKRRLVPSFIEWCCWRGWYRSIVLHVQSFMNPPQTLSIHCWRIPLWRSGLCHTILITIGLEADILHTTLSSLRRWFGCCSRIAPTKNRTVSHENFQTTGFRWKSTNK